MSKEKNNMMAQSQQSCSAAICSASAQHQPACCEQGVQIIPQGLMVKMSLILCSLQSIFNVIFSLQQPSLLVF